MTLENSLDTVGLEDCFIRKKIDILFDDHHNKMKALLDHSLVEFCNPAILDLPTRVLENIENTEQLQKLLETTNSCGYRGFCVGITRFLNNSQHAKLHNLIQKIPVFGVHGTSLKYGIKHKQSYFEVLLKESKLLDEIDNQQKIFVNYDLFTGMLSQIENNFQLTQKKYLEVAAKYLNCSPFIFEVLDTILDYICQIYGNKQRQICVEIPGALGGSGHPELSSKFLSNLCQKIHFFPNIKLCIDLGHLLTWCLNESLNDLDEKKVNNFLKLLLEFKDHIGYLHLSSAGGYNQHFIEAFDELHIESPKWHLPALDLMLPVDEYEMIRILKEIRQSFISQNMIEILESRSYSDVIDDYFPHISYKNSFDRYLEEIELQSKILGYHPKSKIGFAIVGCGHIAKRHQEVLNNISQAKLVGFYDIDPKKMAPFLNSETKGYSSLNELLSDSSIQAIIVCTPSGTHPSIAKQIANANKHAIIEKPLALNTNDMQDVLNAFSSKKLVLSTILQNRFAKTIQYVKSKIDQKILGEIFILNATIRWCRPQSYYDDGWHGTKLMDGGVLMNQGIHFIDLMIYLMEKPVISVSAFGGTFAHNIECEDAICVCLQFDGGGLGLIECSTLATNRNIEGSLAINARHSSIKIGGQCLNKFDYWEGAGAPTNELYEDSSSRHQMNIYNFIEMLREKKPNCIWGKDSYAALSVIEACYKSLETGQVIHLER